jgi:hypothetical protein
VAKAVAGSPTTMGHSIRGFESLPSPPISIDNPDMGDPLIPNFNLVQTAGAPMLSHGSGI